MAWLHVIKASDSPVCRVFLFPHAGAGATAYRDWELPPDFDLVAVQQPGRGPSRAEPACTSLDQLREAVIAALRPTLDEGVPFAFFGHSFGSLAAVEVARGLADRGLAAPLALFLSAHPAPGVTLDDAQHNLSQTATDEVCVSLSLSSTSVAC